jgi:CDP-diacylglycerol--glycerol-3-phosphate 3-phosphatidyltransferase
VSTRFLINGTSEVRARRIVSPLAGGSLAAFTKCRVSVRASPATMQSAWRDEEERANRASPATMQSVWRDEEERANRARPRDDAVAAPPSRPVAKWTRLARRGAGNRVHQADTRYSDAVSGQPQTGPVVPRVRVTNLANVLTLLRLVLVPVFLLALFAGNGHETASRIIAFVVFAVAVITDRFDGALARNYGMVTEFGTMADPIADKTLIGAALIGLSMLGDLHWWVTAVILAREVGITVLRFVMLRHGVIPASRGGKLKTLVQAVAIGLFVLPVSGSWLVAAWVVMAAAIVLTVVTGLDYLASAARDARGRPAAQ